MRNDIIPGMPNARLPLAHKATAAPERLRQFCTFHIDMSHFGVDILDVQEVTVAPKPTKAHHAPRHVAGVVNIRGQIVLCLDLRSILGMPPAEPTADTRLILFKRKVHENLGVLVDRVGDIVEVDGGAIESRHRPILAAGAEPEKTVASSEAVMGVCKLEGALMLILDAAALPRTVDAAFSE